MSVQQCLGGLRFRCIGPPRGGRVVAVHGHPREPMTFYFGACAGGIWKSDDGGAYWRNISDGFLSSSAIGALTVSEADPNVIYAGSGESTLRVDVSYGDGVYRSRDAGKTWRNVGLAETLHISEIRVHPTDPDCLYVAALGHGFGPHPARGVYRSFDGGDSWSLVLHRSPDTGAADLAMDTHNPRILYASMYQVRRSFWNIESGGPESGLWKTSDAGDTWQDLSRNPGLPAGPLGKIGVAVSPARPERVWALIEAGADTGGLYRSEDAGQTWKQINSNRDLMHRAWYYMHVFADPVDADTVYVTNLKMWRSTDGGGSFTEVTTPHGDNHDLWIDPRNPERLIEGNDGGACVSFNGGRSWSSIYNQKTAQFYHVDVDGRYPYRVYGTQQDNSSICVPSATEQGAIPWSACYPAGTGESGYIAVDPKDQDIVYVGAIGSSPGGGNALQRYDHRTRQIRLITTWPENYYGAAMTEMRYRFAWTYPIVFSPHDPDTLYVAGNRIMRTRDEGQSFEAISPDLSRADPAKLMAPGGPINMDTSGAETYGTVYALAECPHAPGTLWAGTDDGLLQLSRDAGETWHAITPPDLPEWALVSMIELCPHDEGTAYVAATRYKLDDYAPYLYRTRDHGHTWTRLESFPAGEITRCVRIDPRQPRLLYVGTETGLFISLDAGAQWHRLQNNFPVVPVYDLRIQHDDLVVATHGRAFWVLDDVTPLREMATRSAPTEGAWLHTPRPTVRQWIAWFASAFRGPGKNYMMGLGVQLAFTEDTDALGEPVREILDGGENPPLGALVYYRVPAAGAASVKLQFSTLDGEPVHAFASRDAGEAAKPGQRYLSTEPGLHRFVWPLRYPDCVKADGDVVMANATTGPVVAPGTYVVCLEVDEVRLTREFDVIADPRVQATQADLEAQLALWQAIHAKLSETHVAVNRIRRIRAEVASARGRAVAHAPAASEVCDSADRFAADLTAIEAALIQSGVTSASDRVRLPAGLNVKLATLASVVASCDAAPTTQSQAAFEHLRSQLEARLAELETLLDGPGQAFSDLVGRQVPAVVLAPPADGSPEP